MSTKATLQMAMHATVELAFDGHLVAPLRTLPADHAIPPAATARPDAARYRPGSVRPGTDNAATTAAARRTADRVASQDGRAGRGARRCLPAARSTPGDERHRRRQPSAPWGLAFPLTRASHTNAGSLSGYSQRVASSAALPHPPRGRPHPAQTPAPRRVRQPLRQKEPPSAAINQSAERLPHGALAISAHLRRAAIFDGDPFQPCRGLSPTVRHRP